MGEYDTKKSRNPDIDIKAFISTVAPCLFLVDGGVFQTNMAARTS